MTSINTIIAVTGYSCWRVWIIKDRVDRLSKSNSQVATASEAFYTVLMLYFLIMSSTTFLTIALFSIFVHVLFGAYVEVFKPEQRLREAYFKSLLEKFWSFLLIDTAITLGCFLLMINFGA